MAKKKSRNITAENVKDFFQILFLAIVTGVLSVFSFLGANRLDNIYCCPEWAVTPFVIAGIISGVATAILLLWACSQIAEE